MGAAWRQRVDSTFEGVKGHGLALRRDLKRFIVIVAAYVAAH
jgi:hypothetical protein